MKRIQKALLSSLILVGLFIPIVIPGYAQSATNTIVVSNVNNDGPGSLRYALLSAEAGTRIAFDPDVFPLNDPQVIYITEELPAITQGNVIIDASNAGVILDGSRLDVTSKVWFDNLEFRINDDIVFTSSFDQNIQNWHKEDPDSEVAELSWSELGSDDTGGSLEITVQPDGKRFVYFYSDQPDVYWWDLYRMGGPVWEEVNPGDRITFEYDYKGFEHSAFYNGMAVPDEEIGPDDSAEAWIAGLGGIDSRENDEWQHVTLSQTIYGDFFKVYPLLSIENYHHGAAIKVSSNGNEIYGLAVRNFYKGIVLDGDDNLVGLVSEGEIIEACVGGCNRIESASLGVESLGSRNLIAGNWIGLTADGDLGNVTRGVGIYGESYRIDNQLVGNWILPRVDGVSIHQQDGLVISENWIGPRLTDSDYVYQEGIKFDEGTTGVVIGPNNTIFNSEFSNIVLFNETIFETEIFENVIIGDHECGLLIGEAKNTTVYDNWFGSLPDGTAYPNFNDFCFNYTTNMTVGPGNQFSYSGGTAINYGDSSGVQITANNFFRNNFGAIDLWGPVGDEPEQPVIIAVSTATLTVVGKTSPEAIVEIYYSEKGEGGDYVFTCQANAAGKFYCTIPKEFFRTDVSVSALARLEDGGTSVFSEPFFVPTPDYTSLTGITGPLSVSTDPQVIGMSIAIAGLLLFSFNGLAEISSRLIEDLSDNNQEGKSKKRTLIQKLTIINTHGRRWVFFLGWVLTLVLIAFAQSMLESHPLFSKQQVELTLLLLGVSAILSLVEVGTEWIARKRWRVACQFCSEINFRGLFFVIGSVALSRILGFSPGVIVGMAGVVFLTPDLSDKRRGPASFWVLLAIFLVSMAAWGLSVLFMEVSPIMETMMLTLFFLGVQSVFFGLIPFGESNGKDIFGWKKVVWIAFSLISLAVFVYMIFMPAFTDVDAMRQNDYLTIYIIGGVLLVISGLLWAANKWHWFEKKVTTQAVGKPEAENDAEDQT